MENLKKLRKDKNLTIRDLATMLGVNPSSISLYENNLRTPSIDILISLTKIFDCSLDFLLDKTKIKNNDTFPENYISLNMGFSKCVYSLTEDEALKLKSMLDTFGLGKRIE